MFYDRINGSLHEERKVNTIMIESREVVPSQNVSSEAIENQSAKSGSAKNGNLLSRPGLRQLVKFCIVGGVSTVIDKGLYWLLLLVASRYAPHTPWWLWQSISFCVAVSNGFIGNRLWTFKSEHATKSSKSEARTQYFKFIVTNIIGLGLNLVFSKFFLIALTGDMKHTKIDDPRIFVLASLCAVPIVVIWNFSAAKFWTFRAPKAERGKMTEGR